jgi:hypothetical protein
MCASCLQAPNPRSSPLAQPCATLHRPRTASNIPHAPSPSTRRQKRDYSKIGVFFASGAVCVSFQKWAGLVTFLLDIICNVANPARD